MFILFSIKTTFYENDRQAVQVMRILLLINRDFTVFYTNYYDITGAVKPAETRRVFVFVGAGGCHD